MTTAAEQPPDRQTQVSGKIVGLIESSSHRPPWMERHRDDRVRAVEDFSSGIAHHAGQPRRQHTAPFILECVNDFPERSAVLAGASRGRKDRAAATAARAERRGRPPAGQRIAAQHATGRREKRHCAPAHVADRIGERMIQEGSARRALRCEKRTNDGIGERTNDLLERDHSCADSNCNGIARRSGRVCG